MDRARVATSPSSRPSWPSRSRGRRGALAAVGAALALAAAAWAAEPPAGAPRSRRVVYVLCDGLRADWVARRVEEGRFVASAAPEPAPAHSGLRRLAARGARARWLNPVEPPLTAPAMLALVTGAQPRRHGVPANRFLLGGLAVVGFDTPLGAEPLWLAARRAGKSVVTIDVPGADCRDDRRRGERAICYAKDADVTAPRSDEAIEGTGRLRLGSREIEVRVEGDAVRLGAEPPARAGDAVELSTVERDGRVTSTIVVVRAVDGARRRARLYVGAAAPTITWPPELAAELDRAGLRWPEDADGPGLLAGRIDRAVYAHTAARAARFPIRAACHLAASGGDLIVLYVPTADAAGHTLLDDEPAIEQALRGLDADLDELVSCLDDGRTAFVIAADHGMAREREALDLQAALGAEGIEARVLPGGGAARLYLARPVEARRARAAIARLVPGARVTADGDGLTVQSPPGLVFAALPAGVGPRAPARAPGAHGHPAGEPSMRASLIVAPPGAAPRVLPPVDQVRVAATVARLLGIAPPRDAAPALPGF